jgi:S-(hydroxymethyl)glutathione dehydrogenase/alcohol dehydrogenase
MKFKAAVCREFAKPLSTEEIELAAPGAGEIRVNVAAGAPTTCSLPLASSPWSSKGSG